MALTVETGSGSANSDAYVTVAETDSYVTDYIRGHSTWSSLSTANKERAIREATQSVDLLWGSRFIGYRSNEDQALEFPRTAGYDADGYAIAGNEIPTKLKHAVAELAWKHANDSGPSTTTGDSTGIIADYATESNVIEENVEAGSVKSHTKYAGIKQQAVYFKKVELILRKLIHPPGQISRA